jgi:hypothetical protein
VGLAVLKSEGVLQVRTSQANRQGRVEFEVREVGPVVLCPDSTVSL